ncbi:hypothetical protein DL93DRAFT_2083304 [Clavulina sp. PMI_390]|nr:hypothetical protein DL93DRAFT_2083304 [Clavulina sp. PMI_390]
MAHSSENGPVNHEFTPPPLLALSSDVFTLPCSELLTVRLPSREQPFAGSTRCTVWENVIEMPANVPYSSLRDLRYIVTPSTRVSQVNVPDEDEEDDYGSDDDDDSIEGGQGPFGAEI